MGESGWIKKKGRLMGLFDGGSVVRKDSLLGWWGEEWKFALLNTCRRYVSCGIDTWINCIIWVAEARLEGLGSFNYGLDLFWVDQSFNNVE